MLSEIVRTFEDGTLWVAIRAMSPRLARADVLREFPDHIITEADETEDGRYSFALHPREA